MKTWLQWFELWQALGSELSNGCAPLFSKSKKWAEVCDAIEKAEAELRPRVDAACRRWMRTGTWPRMTQRMRWFAFLRCVHAATLANLLKTPHGKNAAVQAAPEMTTDTMCEWFLIDSWVSAWPEFRARFRENASEPV